MCQIKEITVFSIGNSLELKSWSNVPYFFTKSLENRNIKINRVNIEENPLLSLVYKYSVFVFLKLFWRNSDHTYFRSGLNYFLTNFQIRNALKKYHSADISLFLTYSFSCKEYSNRKVVLFGDWSYLYKINTFFKRKPYWFEKKALKREEQHINSADVVLSLFPRSNQFNTVNYKSSHQHYLGNVINSEHSLDINKLTAQKLKSNKLLFIGNKKYIKGAIGLINAFKKLSENGNTKIELHIVGLKENEIAIKLPDLYYYGYLNKGIKSENEIYYKLISEAKVIVNTNATWGAFSAITEAMYYYTPVITTSYQEFTETYGTIINFGYYVSNDSIEELISRIEMVLNSNTEAQIAMMQNAHNKVKDFTWENYTDNLLKIITKL